MGVFAGEYITPGKILKKQKCAARKNDLRTGPKNALGSISGKISGGSKVRPAAPENPAPEPPAPLPPAAAQDRCPDRPGTTGPAPGALPS